MSICAPCKVETLLPSPRTLHLSAWLTVGAWKTLSKAGSLGTQASTEEGSVGLVQGRRLWVRCIKALWPWASHLTCL
jgi:hypothetical protein